MRDAGALQLLIGLAIVVAIVIAILWNSHRRRAPSRDAADEGAALRKQLEEVQAKRQAAVDAAARQGVTISRDDALKHVEARRDAYLAAGDGTSAREIGEVIENVRKRFGPRIPINEAQALVDEIEAKFGHLD